MARTETRTVFGASPALLAAFAREGLDSVAGAFNYSGGQDMTRADLGHRHWIRLSLSDDAGQPKTFFMKRYLREPLSWRLRRLAAYGWGQSPAGVETENIRLANAAGIKTMSLAVCGVQTDWLGPCRSFVIVDAVPGEALEQCGAAFIARLADEPGKLAEFTAKLAELVARLHGAGLVHRDLYAAHIFLDERDGVELYLIDLARVFRPRRRFFRWQVKDLAQLKYSMPAIWVERCWDDFLNRCLGSEAPLNRYRRAIDAKVQRISRHDLQLRARRAKSSAPEQPS